MDTCKSKASHPYNARANDHGSLPSLSQLSHKYPSMLCSSVRFLIPRNPRILTKQFSRPPKPTHLDYLPISSTTSLYSRLKSDFPSGSSRLHVHQKTRTPTIGHVLCSLRSDRNMASQSEKPKSVHEFTVKDARGNDVDLSQYKGKVLLIVNVASQCGLTNSNYTELSKLYEKYKDQGLEILAFPCNQFGGQEPGENEQIMEFACTRFKAEFPIFDKVDVNGEKAAPIYKFLKTNKGGILGDGIKWNFAKFLVDKDGNVVDRYAPTTSPLSFEKDVKKLLGTA